MSVCGFLESLIFPWVKKIEYIKHNTRLFEGEGATTVIAKDFVWSSSDELLYAPKHRAPAMLAPINCLLKEFCTFTKPIGLILMLREVKPSNKVFSEVRSRVLETITTGDYVDEERYRELQDLVEIADLSFGDDTLLEDVYVVIREPYGVLIGNHIGCLEHRLVLNKVRDQDKPKIASLVARLIQGLEYTVRSVDKTLEYIEKYGDVRLFRKLFLTEK